MQRDLPTPPEHFSAKKAKILSHLSVPDAEYSDASPKGTVDEGIRDLIAQINCVDGFVTTSSCAGRVSVFVEGRKTVEAGHDGQVAGVGGKGAGGAWLLVSHQPVASGPDDDGWIKSLQLNLGEDEAVAGSERSATAEHRLIHFKFEPMILHVLTASPAHAQLLIRCALQAGFRESGAVNLTSPADQQPTPMVAVRSMGLGFESLVGRQIGTHREQFVSTNYLLTLMAVANDRFSENQKRISRFQHALCSLLTPPPPPPRARQDGAEWEDAAARRERKRAEGLRRKAELQEEKGKTSTAESEEPAETLASTPPLES